MSKTSNEREHSNRPTERNKAISIDLEFSDPALRLDVDLVVVLQLRMVCPVTLAVYCAHLQGGIGIRAMAHHLHIFELPTRSLVQHFGSLSMIKHDADAPEALCMGFSRPRRSRWQSCPFS